MVPSRHVYQITASYNNSFYLKRPLHTDALALKSEKARLYCTSPEYQEHLMEHKYAQEI